jgi:hypothetical protein
MAAAVIIQAGLNSVVATGGTAVPAIPVNINGGIITNPLAAADQGLPEPAETLYVNPMGAATLTANDQTFALAPGQSWVAVPGQTTITTVNAPSSGHKFSVIFW